MQRSEFIHLNTDSRKEFLKYYIIAKHYNNGLRLANLLECLFREKSDYINFAINVGAVDKEED